MHSKIIAEGYYLPDKIITNQDLTQTIDTSDQWIVSRTGISSRHIAAENEFTSDLAVKALNNLMHYYNINSSTIDGIIVATTTADQIFPATASIVQSKLNLRNSSFCFDISAVCAGFVYGLSVADSLIKSGAAKRIAVIGAETMSRIIDWQDRSTCVLFGDGAGAMLLEATNDNAGILGYNLMSDGTYKDILKVDSGISIGQTQAKIFMNGREVYKNAIEKMSSSSQAILQKLGLDISEISWLIPHQANQRIMDAIVDKINLPKDRLISTVATHANTSAASIPLAYSVGVREGKIKAGNLVVFSALGAGLAWGSMVIRV